MPAASRFVIKKVPTTDNVRDMLTKAIDRKTVNQHLKTIGFVEVPPSKLHTILMQRCQNMTENELEMATLRHENIQQQSATVQSGTEPQPQQHRQVTTSGTS